MESHLKFHSVDGKRRIMIVEDELINRELLRIMLEELYDLSFITTGAEAVKAAAAEHDTISLILLDLNLPDMHGLEVLQKIKENELTALVPVIVMTAEKEAEVDCLKLGAIDFISKPYPVPEVVRARVQRTIELSEDRDIIQYTERDTLTGLYNREYFYRYAQQYDIYHRDRPMDAVVIDINRFHVINERYGRSYGDELLKKIGEKIRDCVSDDAGIVCRKEADTFMVYCPHREDYDAIMKSVAEEVSSDSYVHVRMGVYDNVDKDIDMELRFDHAKMAADTIKSSYTRTIASYNDKMREEELFTEQLVEDFRAAIREQQFTVYYQPKYNIQHDEPALNSAEALVRWCHPTLGMISPGIFIPLFEENGLIQELDHYVWEKAAAQIKDWKDRLHRSVPVSVNVSRIDMFDGDLCDNLQNITMKYGLEKGELLLEITESAYTQDSEQVIKTVNDLRSSGFLIEMDDFGSGYSSLNMLSTLPIDALKLDRYFIVNAFKERKNTKLLEVVISLAETLAVPTIAEGVETAEQMFSLKTMGCNIAQGYYFSKPVPAEEFEQFITDKPMAAVELRKGASRRTLSTSSHTYDALHDPVTGLYNHSAFEILYRDSDRDHLGLLIFSIDNYGAIKIEHGQEYADRLAVKVAEILAHSFRNIDDICRLQEDEFVVIMHRMMAAHKDLLIDKARTISGQLQNGEDGVIATLRSGAAFSDRQDPSGDIYEDAGTALERAMKMPEGTCVVY